MDNEISMYVILMSPWFYEINTLPSFLISFKTNFDFPHLGFILFTIQSDLLLLSWLYCCLKAFHFICFRKGGSAVYTTNHAKFKSFVQMHCKQRCRTKKINWEFDKKILKSLWIITRWAWVFYPNCRCRIYLSIKSFSLTFELSREKVIFHDLFF